jgi:hypothetical protein
MDDRRRAGQATLLKARFIHRGSIAKSGRVGGFGDGSYPGMSNKPRNLRTPRTIISAGERDRCRQARESIGKAVDFSLPSQHPSLFSPVKPTSLINPVQLFHVSLPLNLTKRAAANPVRPIHPCQSLTFEPSPTYLPTKTQNTEAIITH